jgi:polyisoprenoid-binding protein YceI
MQGTTPVRGFETTFTIKRSDYGISFGIPGVGDEVTLMVGIEGAK